MGFCDRRDKKDLNPFSHCFFGGVSSGLMGILLLDIPGLPDDNVSGGDLGRGDGLRCNIGSRFSDRVRPMLIHDLRGEGGALLLGILRVLA